ncbi:MAG: bifunctional phosphopantothenoylcysteine decarboxylase/phosphopantothenate--cysteine ligase CoaBC [Hyphomicrobiales bacterium]|nr:MAG: bifunctional phosphopantothenoylcysteine decarboxylase/phosphopantothenate--cysteine ligase CoaBC [Hyphomicrobiales bacterium]
MSETGKSMSGKLIALAVGGGIAAYKTPELVRRLMEQGATVRCLVTTAAQQFVTPLSLATVSRHPVATDLFSAEGAASHIRLAREADLIIVAPATADLIAKFANGHAGDLVSATVLASDRPILLAPAMNSSMWAAAPAQRNVEQLRRDGFHFSGPASGELAEAGEAGMGRMSEPPEIVAAAADLLAPQAKPLRGQRIIVTSGPTREPLDPIRFISNRSSGQQGHAIAGALAALGAEVHLVSGPVTIADPVGVTMHRVESALDMEAAVAALLPADAAIFAAAVGDWRAASIASGKIKKQGPPPALELVENPDILAGVAKGPKRPRLVIGFAAETDDLLANAGAKLARKGADLIVANDIGTHAMGGARNRVSLVSAAGIEPWDEMDKAEVARRLAKLVADRLGAIS